jgi:hypothetical protein
MPLRFSLRDSGVHKFLHTPGAFAASVTSVAALALNGMLEFDPRQHTARRQQKASLHATLTKKL